MGRKNNLNPDYYKVAGRGRQGEAMDQEAHRRQFGEEEAKRARFEGPAAPSPHQEEKEEERLKAPESKAPRGSKGKAVRKKESTGRRRTARAGKKG
jgi:hypothetical protein